MARSPLTEKFLRIVALRDEVKTWPQDEQDFFLDMLAPEPEPTKKPQKKSSKKPAGKGGGGKSKHASSLQQQIKGAGINPNVCQHRDDEGNRCTDIQESAVHTDPTYLSHHQFVAPPAAHAATGD